jgi:hypothetical protein
MWYPSLLPFFLEPSVFDEVHGFVSVRLSAFANSFLRLTAVHTHMLHSDLFHVLCPRGGLANAWTNFFPSIGTQVYRYDYVIVVILRFGILYFYLLFGVDSSYCRQTVSLV